MAVGGGTGNRDGVSVIDCKGVGLMRDMIDRKEAVSRITQLSETLQEPYKSHTILLALFLENKSEFPSVDEDKIMPLICLRCKKDIPLSFRTFTEVSYTHYSYCEDCLREGLKLLREKDKNA